MKPKKERCGLPKLLCRLSHLMETMKEDPSPFISFTHFIYIWGGRQSFQVMIRKIMQYWKNEAINLIAAGAGAVSEISKSFIMAVGGSIWRSEPPKATHHWEIKKPYGRDSSSVDEYILQFKARLHRPT